MVNLSLQSDLKILSESNSTEWYIKDNKNTYRVIEIPIHYDDTTYDHMLIEKWIYKIDVENYYNIINIIYENGYIYVILSDKDHEFKNQKFCRKYKVNKCYLDYPEIFRL